MKNTKIVLLLLLSFVGVESQAQDAELQEKYWNYRHRLRTEFMKVGKDDGHSLPAENRDMNKGCGGIYGNYQIFECHIL
tara:strand:+ start:977 stop:1213 length:237 start_codon:yes stop_codon:yes gene_type:complete